MKKSILSAIIAACMLPCAATAQEVEVQEAISFPGAEGYGRITTGGRGGDVYHVTTLDDGTQEGTFRWACNKSGARTIVFDVSGTIHLTSELRIRNGNVTIAGQTAPGDGICVADYPFVISCPNIIIRYMRFRLGNEALKKDPKAHEGDGLGGMDGQRIMIDHCSVSWSIDECLSVYGSKNITVQWCIVSQSLVNSGHSKGKHGYGGNWGGSGASYHHNLLAHHGSRAPRLGPRPSTQTDERMDLRNNVMYNWGGEGCYGGEGMNVNIVNNYYKPGPATPSGGKGKRMAKPGIRTVDYCLNKDNTATNINKELGTSLKKGDISGSSDGKDNFVQFTYNGAAKKFPINMEANTIEIDGKVIKVVWNDWKKMLQTWGTFHINGNVNTKYDDATNDNWTVGLFNQVDKGTKVDYHNMTAEDSRAFTPIPFVYTTTHSAEDAYEKVLEYAGASLNRDAHDETIAHDAREGVVTSGGTGLIDNQDEAMYIDGTSGWPVLNSTEAPVDTDGDGMPDEWETANGLDPNDPADGKILGEDGYSNLENYLNSLVAHITEAQNEGGKMMNNVDLTDEAIAGIDNINAERPADGKIYNMMGVEVYEPLNPGIYVRDGKKFIIR